jgi:hypothetical protein
MTLSKLKPFISILILSEGDRAAKFVVYSAKSARVDDNDTISEDDALLQSEPIQKSRKTLHPAHHHRAALHKHHQHNNYQLGDNTGDQFTMHDANTGADVLRVAFSTSSTCCCFGGTKTATLYDATGRLIGRLEKSVSPFKFSVKAVEWNVTIFTVGKVASSGASTDRTSAGGTRAVEYEVTASFKEIPSSSKNAKASNFAPHINFELLYSMTSSKRVLQKNDENDTCRKTSDFQTRFFSFLVHNSPKSKQATDLARKGPKFP